MDIMQSLGFFKYTTTIDLNMGYYAMTLDEESKIYCMIILHWGIFWYNTLHMDILVACDIFQWAMGTLFQYLKHLFVYLDDLITLGSESFDGQLAEIDEVLYRLLTKELQVNFVKPARAVQKVAYLGFLINRDGIKPQPIKVQVIVDLKPPSNQKKLRGFLGMVNLYKELWPKSSITLSPLTAMTGKPKEHPFIWTKECQDAFDGMKAIMIQDSLIACPKYGEPFDVHTDASDYQIGGVVSQ